VNLTSPIEIGKATISELPSIPIPSQGSIRQFQLSLNDITVQLSSLGASITSILLPDYSVSAPQFDDVVLSYKSPKDQLQHKNTQFFSAIVGRVANRIKDGKFQLQQHDYLSSDDEIATYHLDRNDGNVNHLHGGYDGFCHRIWDAEMDQNQVKLTLTSEDGDQGYPGGIKVAATFSLVANEDDAGATLKLEMYGCLQEGETKATPIALAQHSYFNLASHSSPERILKHVLHMPHCDKFTPLDNTSIPTKKVQPVKVVKAMDFCQPRTISDALIQYGEQMVGLTPETARENSQQINDGNTDMIFKVPIEGGAVGSNLDGDKPYGFDHNYVIDRHDDDDNNSALRLAAVLSHPPTRRSLSIHTTAPGVQLYTSNYLSGNPPDDLCKGNSKYSQWQGICLETQTFPDSIYSNPPQANDEFEKGRCFILQPGGDDYFHEVHFVFGRIV
jgi:aldose 1-epimerase